MQESLKGDQGPIGPPGDPGSPPVGMMGCQGPSGPAGSAGSIGTQGKYVYLQTGSTWIKQEDCLEINTGKMGTGHLGSVKESFKNDQIKFLGYQYNTKPSMRDEIGKQLLDLLDTDKLIIDFVRPNCPTLPVSFIKQLLAKLSDPLKKTEFLGCCISGGREDVFKLFEKEDFERLSPRNVRLENLSMLMKHGYVDQKLMDSIIDKDDDCNHQCVNVIQNAVKYGIVEKGVDNWEYYMNKIGIMGSFQIKHLINHFGPYTEDELLHIFTVAAPRVNSWAELVEDLIQKGWLNKSEKIYDFLSNLGYVNPLLLPDDKITSKMISETFLKCQPGTCSVLLDKVDEMDEEDVMACIKKGGYCHIILKMLDKIESMSRDNFLICLSCYLLDSKYLRYTPSAEHQERSEIYTKVIDRLYELHRIRILMDELKPYGVAAKLMAEHSEGKNY